MPSQLAGAHCNRDNRVILWSGLPMRAPLRKNAAVLAEMSSPACRSPHVTAKARSILCAARFIAVRACTCA